MNMMKETIKRNTFQVGGTLSTGLAMILTQLLLLLLHFKTTESVKSTLTLPGYPESCGGIPIPYPFGIGNDCSLSYEFNVTCQKNYNDGPPAPYLGTNLFEVRNISPSLGQARVGSYVMSKCYNTTTKNDQITSAGFVYGETLPFWFNTEKNKFTVIGCNTLAYLRIDVTSLGDYSVGCLSSCDSLDTLNKYGSCSGIGCCQTALSKETNTFISVFDDRYNNSNVYNFSRCSYAMVVEEAEFNFDTTYVTTDRLSRSLTRNPLTYPNATLPMVLNWAIENTTCDVAQKNKSSYACRSDHSVCFNSTSAHGGYLCNCSPGYEGNPYLHGGCEDINECADQNPCSKPAKCHNSQGGYRCSCPFSWRSNHNNPRECELNETLLIGTAAGIIALLFLGIVIYVLMEKRNLSKVKEKYFQQHGGWILLEKIKSDQGFGFTIFTKQQVEQATNNFDSSNILGQGGHGTVYKGTLRDEIVAIKKCKIVDESKKKEFGKEMLILSQINHKNIVKILGCCLEVEVPMLVYEFIPNGTLSHYIHYKKQGSHISLETRLRIAHESAEALSYLHTSASPPIFHGDVKSANILLTKIIRQRCPILEPQDLFRQMQHNLSRLCKERGGTLIQNTRNIAN